MTTYSGEEIFCFHLKAERRLIAYSNIGAQGLSVLALIRAGVQGKMISAVWEMM